MADSDNPLAIPAGRFPIVASYVGVSYGWSTVARLFHASSRQVDICVESIVVEAHAADVESGGLSPDQGADYAQQKLARGGWPVIYFSLANWPNVKAGLDRRGVNPGLVGAWVADWDGTTEIEAGWFAHQYQHPPYTGGHWDLSEVPDYWAGLDPPPLVAPPPPPAGLPEHEVQVAWAKLGDVLGSILPGLNDALVGTGTKLGEF